jgi:DNA-binding IclR family transcriptional regulator
MASTNDRYTVDAAAKALSLLDAFSVETPALSLSQLIERTGLPRATAFRLLATLEQASYLVKEGTTYSLGFKLYALGNIVAEGLDLRRAARRDLEALRDETNETVQLAVLEDWQVVHLDRVLSRHAVAYMVSHVGAILPAYCTALGKALLAYQDQDMVYAWASTQEFRQLTPTTLTSADALTAELDRIRARGYSIDAEERQAGVRCIGAPVFGHDGEVVAAISLGAPTERLPKRIEGSKVALQVMTTSLAISRTLGYVRNSAASSRAG